jgi:hypothetical protein
MNIVDILIGFVGGGAIGSGALYALQQGKISEALQKYEKMRTALGDTETELKDVKGQLKLLDVSEERIRSLEARYREEVAKLQHELEDSQARLQEAAIATPSKDLETSYKIQIQELQEGYEAKIEELRQSYQTQIQEVIEANKAEIDNLRQNQQAQILELENGYQSQIQQLEQGYQTQIAELQNIPQPVVAELPIAEDYQTTQIVEPWDDFPDSPSAEFVETAAEITGLEEVPVILPEEVSSEIDFLESLQPEMTDMAIEGFTSEPEFALETEAFADFGGIEENLEPEFVSEMGTFEGFTAMEESIEPEFTPEMATFDSFGVEEESAEPAFIGERGTVNGFETMVDSPEFAPEMATFDGFETMVDSPEFAPEMATFDGFETMVENIEPEFAPEKDTFTDVTAMENTFVSPELTVVDDFYSAEETQVFEGEEQAISNLDMSAADMEFLNGLQLEEEIKTINSLEELSGSYDDIFSTEAVSNDTSFFDLLPTDSEKFADSQNSLDDLFADASNPDTSELFNPFGEEISPSQSQAQNGFHMISDQEELDFFSMLDDSETGNMESLTNDEELPLDDLFSDDLFSEWDNKSTHTDKLESHQ